VKPQAVLFDLDGTLVDTIRDIAICMNRVLRRHGEEERDLATYRRSVGWGIRALVERLIPAHRATDAYIRELAVEMRREYNAHPVMESEAYREVAELLPSLWDAGVPTAVLSNKADEITQQVVNTLFPGHAFRLVSGAVDGVPKKPDPGSALRISGELGIPAAEWAFVGDTAIDMETAERAGMRPIGVSWGFRSVAELEAAGAELIVRDGLEILSLLRDRAG